jgi:predicted MPP superfamily phosphohydrolase
LSLWQLHNFLPKGAQGNTLPLWPGKLAAGFLFLGVVYAGLVWLRANQSQPDRYRRAGLAALALACFGLLDWALLAALPRLGLSFGPLTFPLIAITGVRLAVFTILALPLCLWSRLPGKPHQIEVKRKLLNIGLVCLWLANLALLAAEVDGLYIEPFDIHTTELHLLGPSKAPGEPLRILHLTDLHVERITRRELDLIQQVKTLKPDLILLTGDYANVDYLDDARTLRDTRTVLAELSAPFGVYAVIGSVDGPYVMHKVFDGLPITVLEDRVQKLPIGEREIDLVGVSNYGSTRDGQILSALMKQVPQDVYSILLYHTPDLIEVANRLQIDLYLAGHTHGGQVRLPLWGAIITMSAYGKQYESGLYQLNPTTLYVSRGIGMEGLSLPRVRFLCPPEMVLIDMGNEAPNDR